MMKRFFKSIGYALKGIGIGIMEERNIRIDIIATLYVFFFSKFYNFTKSETVLVIVICFIIIAFEMMNTAIERTVKNPHPDRYMIAGEAKDTAAGAVLLAAVGALIAGILLFWDIDAFKSIFLYFKSNPIRILALLISLLLSYFAITIDKSSMDKK